MMRPLSRDEVRDVDRRAIEEYGMPGVVLMENAGRGAADLLWSQRPQGPLVVCAGAGNNGGDGFVIARHLENRGAKVTVLLFSAPGKLHGDAATNYRILTAAKTPLRIHGTDFDDAQLDTLLQEAEWIVDALLGTGMQGAVREPFAGIIAAINRAGRKVLAVDLPSGLDCDTGRPLGECVRATRTATFVAPKLGFANPESRRWTGPVDVIDIGVPRMMLEEAGHARP